MASILQQNQSVNPLSLDSVLARRISRELRRNASPPDARIAFAGAVVFESLPEFIEAQLACRGVTAASHITPFGRAMQELLDLGSGLHAFDPGFLLLHFELDSLAPDYPQRLERRAGRECIADILDAIDSVVDAALARTRATVLVGNFAGPECYELGLADWRAEFSEQDFFSALNSGLARAYRAEPRVQILDLERLTACYGRARARDRRLYYVARIPWRSGFLPVLADEIARHVSVGLGKARKCLVVDLDNTLWGGVLGEDGPLGVRIGQGDSVGEAHFDLQRRILAFKRRGILLAACSKNNPAAVEDMFRVRTDMPLRREDFACMQVGWDMKHEGLRAIAADLNIGTDALVFLDDNPAEIELIRERMPEVECVLAPSDAAMLPTCLDAVHGLERAVITDEDLKKTGHYRQSAVRASARRQFSDVTEYLHGLATRIAIRPAGRELLARAHQLFSKTNQFNLTTQRYSAGELERFATDPSCRLLMIRAEDRFGDLGWIGAVLLRNLDAPAACIDSFLLSCRAMGRGIESAILNYVKTICFEQCACEELHAKFRATSRNAPVRELYDKHGFALIAQGEEGAKDYRLARRDSMPTPCSWISVEREWQDERSVTA